QPVDSADNRVGAADDNANHFAADEQNQPQVPFFFDAECSVRNAVSDCAAYDDSHHEGQGEVGKGQRGLVVDNGYTALQRLDHLVAAGIEGRFSGKQWQQACVGNSGGVGTDGDE